MEVPEIYDGIVEIMAAAREPGQRAKVAVRAKDPVVDPVGACVGMKGSRVQNIVQELQGEKIDIVLWDEDVTRFVYNALAPAEISKVYMDEVNKEMDVVVPDHQLSLAIGKKGQNVRLAAKLTGWKIDILSESKAAATTAEAIFNLMLIPGMSETMAQNIYQYGYGSFQDIAGADAVQIRQIPGYEEGDKAAALIEEAKSLVEKYAQEGVEVPKAPVSTVAVAPASSSRDAKSQADQRLKEELGKLQSEEDASHQAEEVIVDSSASPE
jgi:N utilization substance protein A